MFKTLKNSFQMESAGSKLDLGFLLRWGGGVVVAALELFTRCFQFGSDMTGLKIVHLHWSVLTIELRELRAHVDGLAVRFSKEYGSNSEALERAEGLSVAIQRLERALLQQQLQRISAASGAGGGAQ
ncbi:MAG TPA: hypothetical protein VNV82_06845 [Bryobacteraceae bacterium]|nr:hypothetical protein [Bryobacteraceae bacterium]